MVSTFRRMLSVVPVVAALALAVTACSSTTGGVATISAEGGDSTGGDGDLPTGVTAEPGTGSTDVATFALDMQVRLVNLWTPLGSTEGGALDVWVGDPKYGGKKLRTVQYGEVTDFFAPEVPDPAGVGRPTDPNVDWSFSYYVAGKTDEASELMNKSETSAPGLKLTIALYPGDPTMQGGMSLQVMADDVGSDASGSGFTESTFIKPEPGTAGLLLNATAMQYRGPDGKSANYVLSNPDGSCTPYLDSDTGKVHDDEFSTELAGGTRPIQYVVKPGNSVRVNLFDDSQATTDEKCHAAPAVDTTDPGLADDGRAYAFLWGADAAKPKLTIVPAG